MTITFIVWLVIQKPPFSPSRNLLMMYVNQDSYINNVGFNGSGFQPYIYVSKTICIQNVLWNPKCVFISYAQLVLCHGIINLCLTHKCHLLCFYQKCIAFFLLLCFRVLICTFLCVFLWCVLSVYHHAPLLCNTRSIYMYQVAEIWKMNTQISIHKHKQGIFQRI